MINIRGLSESKGGLTPLYTQCRLCAWLTFTELSLHTQIQRQVSGRQLEGKNVCTIHPTWSPGPNTVARNG